MRSIWKFPLGVRPDDTAAEVTMPEGAAIVHFEALVSGRIADPETIQQHPTVWALVDSDNPPEPRRFRIFGTGHPLPRGARHVGTYGDVGGPFVWHVFEMVGEPLPDGLDLPADAEAAYRTLTGAGFKCEGRAAPVPTGSIRCWLAPDDEPLTTEQIMAVATLQEYGFGPVVSK